MLDDRAHMARCLELARKYEGRTAPNPIVGCVIVDARGRVIAEGAHKRAGTAHAEAVALKKLGGNAKGATLYCSLEPCTHQGSTPPCTPAVIASGVKRVVIGSVDPVPGHGGGIKALKRAGIRVARALVAECDRANRPFLTWARHGRCAFSLKAAMTLDGKIATVSGASQYITGVPARNHVWTLRDSHDAILVGIGTLLADDPRLTVHGAKGMRDPRRVILDSHLRTPVTAQALPATIVCRPDASAAREKALVARGAEVWRTDPRDLPAVGRRLAEAGIRSVLVEGGGQVHAAFLDQDLCDQLFLYVAPLAVGGPAPSWIGGTGRAALADAWRFELDAPIRLGNDFLFTGQRATK